MKAFFAFLALFAFVTIQLVDIAVLDNGHPAAAEVHAQLDLDNESAPDGPDNCEIHCGCHMLHHMGPAGSTADYSLSPNAGQKFAFGQDGALNFNSGPPTPPPLA